MQGVNEHPEQLGLSYNDGGNKMVLPFWKTIWNIL